MQRAAATEFVASGGAAAARAVNPRVPLVIRSTVPVGFTDRLAASLATSLGDAPTLFMPEFLREGSAMHDSLHPSRVIVGGPPADAEAVAALWTAVMPPAAPPVRLMTATEAEAVEIIAERAARTPKGEWILGYGWDEGAWANRYPDKRLLSQRVPDHPVVLRSLHGFASWANERALAMAGITRDTLAMRMKDDDWAAVIDTNLSAVFRLSRAVLRPMMKAKGGRIVSITSVVGSTGNPGQANYAAAKAGVEGMTRALAREVGSRGITVNCVAPGFIDTDMTRALNEQQTQALLGQIPLGRLGQPDDIAACVAFLASAAGAYVTGATMHVNGGMYMN